MANVHGHAAFILERLLRSRMGQKQFNNHPPGRDGGSVCPAEFVTDQGVRDHKERKMVEPET